jgi:hypothetical protein
MQESVACLVQKVVQVVKLCTLRRHTTHLKYDLLVLPEGF